jgi:hypothetical protein
MHSFRLSPSAFHLPPGAGRIRRAGWGRIRQKWCVCATSATNSRIRRAAWGKNWENGIRRATNSPIRRAENGKNPENGIRRATNSPIRRADRGRIRQKWAVCATRATNPPIRRAGLGKIREIGTCCATNHAQRAGSFLNLVPLIYNSLSADTIYGIPWVRTRRLSGAAQKPKGAWKRHGDGSPESV